MHSAPILDTLKALLFQTSHRRGKVGWSPRVRKTDMRETATIRILSRYRADPSSRTGRIEAFFKRALDILVSGIGLLLLAPFFAWVGLRIRRDTPGPVFYHGLRVGQEGKVFRILKFRTMREPTERETVPKITARDDPRITPFGRWLRDSKVNELPQLWNVLKGEMSLVGPRPEDPHIASSWPAEAAQEILSLRPGITSPASVLYHDEETLLESARLMDTYLGEILPSKLRLDQLYVRHHSFWGDVDILFWTLMIMLPRKGSQEPPESSLFLGPFTRLMRRHVSWFVMDLLTSLANFILAGLFYRTLGPLHVGWGSALLLALIFALLYSLVNAALHVNRVVWSRARAADAFDLLPGVMISLAVTLLLNNLLPAQWLGIPQAGENTPGVTLTPWGTRALVPNGMLILSAGLSLVGFLATRYRTRLLTGAASRWVSLRGVEKKGLEKVLIVGGGETGQMAAWMLSNGKYALSLQVIGLVDDDLYKQDSRIHGLDVLGGREDIPELVAKHDVGIIIFAIHNISDEDRQRLYNICQQTQARVFMFPDIPAALQNISSRTNGHKNGHNGNGNGNGKKNASGELLVADLAGSLFAAGIAPEKIDSWLKQLEETMQSGDASEALQQIQIIRSLVHGVRHEVAVEERVG